MNARIIGLGTASPTHRIGLEAAARVAGEMSCSDPKQLRTVEALYRRSGVTTRGSVLLEDPQTQSFYPAAESAEDRGPGTQCRSERFAVEAPILAVASARQAVARAGVSPDQITHLVTVSCTGFHAPGVDIELIDQLGLPRTTERVQVGFMGCHGSINGLRAARGLIASQPNAKVLLCSVELCSLHYQYGFDADRIVSGALFADGSASAVLVGETDQCQSVVGQLAATGSYLVPNCRDAMTWKIGDYGFEMTLSASVPGLIESELRSFLSRWLGEHGLSIEQIAGWAVHPGGARILTAVERTLSLSDDCLAASRQVLAEHGNMSSATMLFIVEQFAQQEMHKPWLMLGFGPGLEIEVALIR